MFRFGIQIPADTAGICWYGWYKAGTADISTGMKHRGQSYWIAGRYGIFRPYRPVRYGIDNIDTNWTKKQFSALRNFVLGFHTPGKRS